MQTLKQFKTQQMKKDLVTILAIIAILLLCTIANAQPVKKDTAVKKLPAYTIDGNKQFDLTVHVTLYQVNDFLTVSQQGVQAITSSPRYTGAQITSMLANYKAVLDSVSAKFTGYLAADRKRFIADSLKKESKR